MVLSSTNFRASLGTLLAEVEDYLAIVLGYTKIYILLSSFLFPFGIKKIKKYILSLEEIAKILILILTGGRYFHHVNKHHELIQIRQTKIYAHCRKIQLNGTPLN